MITVICATNICSSSALPAFAGDSFANAPTVGLGTFTADNTTATKESGEPDHAGVSGGHSIWWKFVAPQTVTYAVSTAPSIIFDTVLAVYTGSAVDALSEVVSNDEAIDSLSFVTFAATSGQTYYIAVDGYGEYDIGIVGITITDDEHYFVSVSDSALTSLDVSTYSGMGVLDCANNLLTVLDVSQNAALIHLDCRFNSLTNIDLTANVNLMRFNCGVNTALAALDISANPLLIWVKAASCSFPSAVVDAILVTLDNNGHQNGLCHLYGDNALPSATGEAAAANLVAKGWAVSLPVEVAGASVEEVEQLRERDEQ